MLTEILAVSACLVSVATIVWAVIRERFKPKLDEAQTGAVRAEAAKTVRNLNVARDQRILELELWGDGMRSYVRAVVERDDQMCDLIKNAYALLNMPVPDIAALPVPPKFPEPRPAA